MRLDLSASRPCPIAQQDSYSFGAAGRILVEKHPARPTVGERIPGSLGQLHFGWFGGGAIRIAYGLLGLAWSRPRASRSGSPAAATRARASAALKRLRAAICWGQPFAIAATLPVGLVEQDQAPERFLTGLWAACSVILAAGASAVSSLPASRISTGLRRGRAALLFLAATLHLLRPGHLADDPRGLVVDGMLIVAGLILAKPRVPGSRQNGALNAGSGASP